MNRTLFLALLFACRDPAPIGESKEEMTRKLAGITPGEERDMGGGTFMKLFRVGATEPMSDGWNLAHSTEGGFSVELPLPFNDFRIRGETTDHVEMRNHAVGGKTPGLLAWSATCTVRRDGQLGNSARPPAPEKIEMLGTPPRAQSRTIEFDDAICILIVEAQGTDPLPPEADRLRFLHSLKRSGKPVW